MPAPTRMTVVELRVDGVRTLHGPHRRDVAERIAAGARATGATVELVELTGEPVDGVRAFTAGEWPPHGFAHGEVGSIYVEPAERFVVSLVAGYGGPDGVDEVRDPAAAALACLDLTRDDGADGTRWFVHDRQTGQMHSLEQRDFDRGVEPHEVAGVAGDGGDGGDAAPEVIRDAGSRPAGVRVAPVADERTALLAAVAAAGVDRPGDWATAAEVREQLHRRGTLAPGVGARGVANRLVALAAAEPAVLERRQGAAHGFRICLDG